jgi:hypothetical protein
LIDRPHPPADTYRGVYVSGTHHRSIDGSIKTYTQIGVLYWTFDADQYQSDPKFAVRILLLLLSSVDASRHGFIHPGWGVGEGFS